ncbi:LytR family transcriptional regulator [Geitlerinema sp. P-1104]|uniref:LCP family protein n=1 Tax=Geitlerinema sp. P-1104 TaxID=2546230 RepID=UPI0014770459|nr:LytR family transcriptional regulator [Geitlerinema sp. P-1104]
MRIPLQQPRNWSGLLWWGLLTSLIIVASALMGAIAALIVPTSPLVQPSRRENRQQGQFGYELTRPVNLMVLGVDRDPELADDSPDLLEGRSDTILAVRFDTYANQVNVLSVPRDTEVNLGEFGWGKLNEANYLGGVALMQSSLEAVLTDVEFDRYFRVNTQGLVELVDLVGGVDVLVPFPMSYRDRTQELTIELAAGWQRLTGEQAQQFSRYRQGPYGDIGRVQRQQMLLQALRDRLVSPTVLTRIPAIIRILQTHVDTNLTVNEMLALASFALEIDHDNLRMALLPGEFSNPDSPLSYWRVDEAAGDRLVGQFFQTSQESGFIDEWGNQTAFGRTDSQASGSSTDNSPLLEQPRITIQNATQDSLAVERLAAYLEELGYEDIYVGQDWDKVQRHSTIIVQRGDYEAGERLRSALGFGRLEALSTGDIGSDLTIRIGLDVDRLFRAQGGEGEPE